MATTVRKALSAKSGNAKPHPLDITYRPAEALRPDPRQLRHLTQSIKAFGFNVPILIDADDRVLAGHARLLAAQELGLKQVPTYVLCCGQGRGVWLSRQRRRHCTRNRRGPNA